MNRTVNKKAILIMLGSIAGAGLLYFGGFLLAGIHNNGFNPANNSRYVNAVSDSLAILCVGMAGFLICVILNRLFNVLFPKKEETK